MALPVAGSGSTPLGEPIRRQVLPFSTCRRKSNSIPGAGGCRFVPPTSRPRRSRPSSRRRIATTDSAGAMGKIAITRRPRYRRCVGKSTPCAHLPPEPCAPWHLGREASPRSTTVFRKFDADTFGPAERVVQICPGARQLRRLQVSRLWRRYGSNPPVEASVRYRGSLEGATDRHCPKWFTSRFGTAGTATDHAASALSWTFTHCRVKALAEQ